MVICDDVRARGTPPKGSAEVVTLRNNDAANLIDITSNSRLPSAELVREASL
jgi:hypothetical protein